MAAKLTEFGDRSQSDIYNGALDEIVGDIHSVHIILNSVNGHGKTSSLRTIIKHLKEADPGVIIKIFDISQAWFHQAPVEHRQRVTAETLRQGRVVNVGDCVYEMGELERPMRRGFVGEVIRMDYQRRQTIKRLGGEAAIKREPLILYVLEEANTYFDSNSLIRRDAYATILNDFVSVGRNYNLGGVLVVTRMKGELAPGIRERCNLLIGRVSGEGELRSLASSTSREIKELIKSIKKFHWIYWNGEKFGPFRIRDLVKSVPQAYITPKLEVEEEEVRKPWGKWRVVAITTIITFLACLILFRL